MGRPFVPHPKQGTCATGTYVDNVVGFHSSRPPVTFNSSGGVFLLGRNPVHLLFIILFP